MMLRFYLKHRIILLQNSKQQLENYLPHIAPLLATQSNQNSSDTNRLGWTIAFFQSYAYFTSSQNMWVKRISDILSYKKTKESSLHTRSCVRFSTDAFPLKHTPTHVDVNIHRTTTDFTATI